MALSRKFLKELLAEYENRDEIIDQIIDAHSETVAELKAERANIESEIGMPCEELHAEVESIESEINRMKAADVDENEIMWKTRYEEEKTRHEAFKAEAEKDNAYREKQRVYRDILTSCNVPYRIRELILESDKNTINGLEVSFGKVRNLEEIKSNIIRDYGEFIPKATRSQHGAV